MKKEVKRYTVIQSLTEDGIKNIGSTQFLNDIIFKKYLWLTVMYLIASLGMVILIEQDKSNNFGNFILLCGVLIPYGWSVYKIYKARKTLWNKVKDLPEPIDLREIK